MNYFVLFLFFINVLLVLGLKQNNSKDCEDLSNFFTKGKKKKGAKLNIPKCTINNTANNISNDENKSHFIECDANGHITEIDLRYSDKIEDIDFSDFPILTNLKKLTLEGDIFLNNAIPTRFFEMPNLEELNIIGSKINVIPEKLPKNLPPLKTLNLTRNFITGFPTIFLDLSTLKVLDLSLNSNLGSLPTNINYLDNLEELYLENTGIIKIPDEIYHLTKLRYIDISNNRGLNFKAHRFEKELDTCNFKNISIECYEMGTCKNFVDGVDEFNKKIIKEEKDVAGQYVTCKNENNEYNIKPGERKNKSVSIITIIIIVLLCILFVFIIIFLKLRSMKKKQQEEEELKEALEEDISITQVSPNVTEKSTEVDEIKSSDIASSKLLPSSNSSDIDSSKLPPSSNHSKTNSLTITPASLSSKLPPISNHSKTNSLTIIPPSKLPQSSNHSKTNSLTISPASLTSSVINNSPLIIPPINVSSTNNRISINSLNRQSLNSINSLNRQSLNSINSLNGQSINSIHSINLNRQSVNSINSMNINRQSINSINSLNRQSVNSIDSKKRDSTTLSKPRHESNLSKHLEAINSTKDQDILDNDKINLPPYSESVRSKPINNSPVLIYQMAQPQQVSKNVINSNLPIFYSINNSNKNNKSNNQMNNKINNNISNNNISQSKITTFQNPSINQIRTTFIQPPPKQIQNPPLQRIQINNSSLQQIQLQNQIIQPIHIIQPLQNFNNITIQTNNINNNNNYDGPDLPSYNDIVRNSYITQPMMQLQPRQNIIAQAMPNGPHIQLAHSSILSNTQEKNRKK